MKAWYLVGLLACVVLPKTVTADEGEKEYGFYLGGTVGMAMGDVSADDMNARMAEFGYDANAEVDNQNRTAWSLGGGYRWNHHWEVQLGYTDLGSVRTRLSGNAADIDDYLISANLVHPRSGSGYEAALLGRYPLSNKSYLYGRGGMLFVDSRYRANDDTNIALRNDSEEDLFFGAGYGYEINNRLGLRLSLDRYRIDGENIPVVGVGLLYKFKSHSPAKPRPAPEPTPEPIVAPAEEPAPPVLAAPVSMKLAINFGSDSAVVEESDLSEVARLADFMNRYTNSRVVLEGHTDNRGNDMYNKDLSKRRARAVHDLLIETMGIAAERVSFIGYGEERPVADNATAEGRAANRRVMAEITN